MKLISSISTRTEDIPTTWTTCWMSQARATCSSRMVRKTSYTTTTTSTKTAEMAGIVVAPTTKLSRTSSSAEDGTNPYDADGEPDVNDNFDEARAFGDLDDTNNEARAHEQQREGDGGNPNDTEREVYVDEDGANGDLDDTDDEARAHEQQREDGTNPDDAEGEPDVNDNFDEARAFGDLDNTDDEARTHEQQREDRGNPNDTERELYVDEDGANGDLDNTDDEAPRARTSARGRGESR